MNELDKLLSRLPKAVPTIFEGRPLSRDDENLHLATATGIIAIPIAEIQEVRALTGARKDLVGVDVKHGDRVKYVRQVGARRNTATGDDILKDIIRQSRDTWTTGNLDTATTSDGVADATDDTAWLDQNDDDGMMV